MAAKKSDSYEPKTGQELIMKTTLGPFIRGKI